MERRQGFHYRHNVKEWPNNNREDVNYPTATIEKTEIEVEESEDVKDDIKEQKENREKYDKYGLEGVADDSGCVISEVMDEIFLFRKS